MNHWIRTLGLTLLLLAAGVATAGADAGGARQAAGGRAGRASYTAQWARGPIEQHFSQNRWSTSNLRIRKLGETRTQAQFLVADRDSGVVRSLRVTKANGAVIVGPIGGALEQGQATRRANLVARRERTAQGGRRGGLAGVTRRGLSNSGDSYEYGVATDRNQTVFVNVRTGETRNFDR